jgi:hypothetical protein
MFDLTAAATRGLLASFHHDGVWRPGLRKFAIACAHAVTAGALLVAIVARETRGIAASGLIIAAIVWLSRADGPLSLLKRRGRTDAKLAKIVSLDTAKLTESTRSDLNWKTIRLECLERMTRVNSYCSRSIIEGLSPKKIVMQWRVDFVAPERWHVTQEAEDRELGTLMDEWVSIGDQNYQNAGMWFRTEGDLNRKTTQCLSINGLMQIVCAADPVATAFFQHERSTYLVAQYPRALAVSSDASLFAALAADEAATDLEIWIDVGSKHVIKGVMSRNNGADEIGRVSQVFACFNEAIRVEPPSWLNAVRDPSGGYTVVNVRLPKVHHHR